MIEIDCMSLYIKLITDPAEASTYGTLSVHVDMPGNRSISYFVSVKI